MEGVSILTDIDLARDIHRRLGSFSHGPRDFFPVNWPVTLSRDNMDLLERSYVVRAKAHGPRFLLYVDELGALYMENQTQQVFRIDHERALQLPNVTDTVLDGILAEVKRTGERQKSKAKRVDRKQFVFFVHDAILVGGVDITQRGILERIACVQVECVCVCKMDRLYTCSWILFSNFRKEY